MQVLDLVADAVLADGGGYHHAAGWGWVMMAGWWVMVIVAIVLVMRALPSGGRRDRSETSDAESILARRFATGEIDADEYRVRLSALRS